MQAAKDNLPHQIFLFYSNHRPEDTAFLQELRALEKQNPHYKFIPTMTDMDKSKYEWQGEIGYVNKKVIRNIYQRFSETYFIDSFQAPLPWLRPRQIY